MRGCAVCAAGLQEHGHQGLSVHRARGHRVGLYGPAEKQPAPPQVEWCTLPAARVFVSKRLQECSYLQAMEGGIDTSHVSYVHRFEVDDDPMHQGTKANDYIKADGNVIFEIEKSDFGLTLYGRRNGEPDSWYWRASSGCFRGSRDAVRRARAGGHVGCDR